MSALNVENEETTMPVQEAVELLDCGRASKRTQGINLPLILELGVPPNNYLLVL
jgi:hypothetical protein